MRKIYIVTISTLLSVSYFWAQPTISSIQLSPVTGESISIIQSDWMSPGIGGNNMTWDFSSLSNNQSATLSVLGADPNFPGTNQTHHIEFSEGSVSNSYMEITPIGQLQHGFDFTYSGNTLSYSYTNSEKLVEVPLDINTIYSDNYSGTFSLVGIPGTRDGNVSFEVDGYGTIITPSGTYTDVLRVKFVNTHTDVSIVGINTSSQITYLWYKAGIHYPILYLTENLNDPSLNEGAYFAGSTVDISEINQYRIAIYPNPLEDKLFISVDPGVEIKTIRMIDLVGHEVNFQAYNVFNKEITLDNLKAGCYQLNIELSNGEFISKSLVKE